jgi:hypothetical protein
MHRGWSPNWANERCDIWRIDECSGYPDCRLSRRSNDTTDISSDSDTSRDFHNNNNNNNNTTTRALPASAADATARKAKIDKMMKTFKENYIIVNYGDLATDCADPTLRGPSIYNQETGLACDTTTRTLHDLSGMRFRAGVQSENQLDDVLSNTFGRSVTKHV